jgi:HEAT repeat protein
VHQFGIKGREVDALRQLTGGVTATHLRAATIGEDVYAALLEGLRAGNPRVRWWCVHVLDHVPDVRAIAAIEQMLDDPVPRVRRSAVHALGCATCKRGWNGALSTAAAERLPTMATEDPNAKVRAEVRYVLNCNA